MNWKIEKRNFHQKINKINTSKQQGNPKYKQEVIERDEQICLGNQIIFIKQQENHKGIILCQCQKIQKILKINKCKFIIMFDQKAKGQNSCISIYQNPVYYDEFECKYHLLKLHFNQNSIFNQQMVQIAYLMCQYTYIHMYNKNMIKFISKSLEKIKPDKNKFNYLFFYQNGQEDMIAESTAFDTNEGFQARQQLINSEKSEDFYSNQYGQDKFLKTEEFSQKSKCKLRSGKKNRSIGIQNQNNFNKYFCKVIYVDKVLNNQNKIIQSTKQYQSHGLNYGYDHIIAILDTIKNKKNINIIENLLLKISLNFLVQICKKIYLKAVKSWFEEAKSLQFDLLRNRLLEIYQKLIETIQEEFQYYINTQNLQIHIGIFKRWIQQKQNQVFLINDMLFENQCFEYLSEYLNDDMELPPDTEQLINYFQRIKLILINNKSLQTIIETQYLSKMKKFMQILKIRKNKDIKKQINYYENRPQMLKNSETRIKLSTEKKNLLEKAIQILIFQNQTLDNLYHGFQIQYLKQQQTLHNVVQMPTPRKQVEIKKVIQTQIY